MHWVQLTFWLNQSKTPLIMLSVPVGQPIEWRQEEPMQDLREPLPGFGIADRHWKNSLTSSCPINGVTQRDRSPGTTTALPFGTFVGVGCQLRLPKALGLSGNLGLNVSA